jgi:hypothetical protein
VKFPKSSVLVTLSFRKNVFSTVSSISTLVLAADFPSSQTTVPRISCSSSFEGSWKVIFSKLCPKPISNK